MQQASDVNRRATLGPLLCQLSAGGDSRIIGEGG